MSVEEMEEPIISPSKNRKPFLPIFFKKSTHRMMGALFLYTQLVSVFVRLENLPHIFLASAPPFPLLSLNLLFFKMTGNDVR